MAYPSTLPEQLWSRSEGQPEALGLAVDRGGFLTFRDWERRSNALARGLAASGARPGDRVALVFDNQRWLDYAVAYAAVIKAGAVAVPLAPRLSPLDLLRILRHCEAVATICPPDLAPPGDISWAPGAEFEHDHSGDTLPFRGRPDDVAEVRYPSGALALPRPTNWTHRDLLSRPGPWAGCPSAGVFLHCFLPGSDAGQRALLGPLSGGWGTSLVVPGRDADRLARLVARYGIECAGLTAPMATMVAAAAARGSSDLSPLRQLIVTGAGSQYARGQLATALPRVAVTWLDPDAGEAPVARVVDIAPIGPAQEGMVWHEQFAPGSFNLSPLVRWYRGPLDTAAFNAALREIRRRHDCLRSTFTIAGGRPAQVLGPVGDFFLPVVDLSRHEFEQRRVELDALISRAKSDPFDLVTGPLWDPTLVRLEADDHVLIVRVHHAVFDDWSVGPFRRELSALYGSFLAGRPSPLAEPKVSFADFCRRRRQALDGAQGQAERAFWRRELHGAAMSVQLPIDDPERPAGSPHRAATPVSRYLPAEVSDAVRVLAREQRTTVFIVLLAAFAVLGDRYCGLDDVVLSTLVANRNRTELEGLIGCFGKKILLRVRLGGDPTFAEVVGRARQALIGALAHQDSAYEAVLQDALGPAAARHGLVPQVAVKFQAEVVATDKLSLPGLTTSGVPAAGAGAARPHFLSRAADEAGSGPALPWGMGLYLGTFLGLSVSEADGRLGVVADGVFHPPAVDRLLRHYASLVGHIVAQGASGPVSQLSLLDDGDQAELLRLGRGRDVPTVPDGNTAAVFEAQTARTPDRVAVTFGEENLSYAALDRRAQRLADRLGEVGVGAGDVVAICVPPGVAVVVAVLAVWKAGAAYVPLDPGGAAADWEFIGADAGARAVVATPAGAGPFAPRDGLVVVDTADRATDGAPRAPRADTGSLALVRYHPGPDGKPLGVEIGHRSVLHQWALLRHEVYGTDRPPLRIDVTATPCDDGFVRQLVGILGGHTLQLCAPRDGSTIVARLAAGTADVVVCGAQQLRQLVDCGLEAVLAARLRHWPRAKVVLATEGPLDSDLWWAWRHIGRALGDRAELHQLWGPAEWGLAVTHGTADTAPARPSVGRAAPNTRCYVLDRRARVVPLGATGELHVAGPGLVWRYRGLPELTRACSIPDPLESGEPPGPVFSTGWRARFLPDGNIELLGRLQDTVDVGGFLVDVSRVEAVVSALPEVARVAVVLRQDVGGEKQLVAYVEPHPGGPAPTLERLRTRLWSRLPGYAWPAVLVVRDTLPETANGSVDRAALASLDPSLEAHEAADDRSAISIASLWAAARGGEAVEGRDNYWQSFSFLEALAAARADGAAIPPECVLRNRTVATLAADLHATAIGSTDSAAEDHGGGT